MTSIFENLRSESRKERLVALQKAFKDLDDASDPLLWLLCSVLVTEVAELNKKLDETERKV